MDSSVCMIEAIMILMIIIDFHTTYQLDSGWTEEEMGLREEEVAINFVYL